MIVSCSNCNSKYTVDDSKIIGKRFGFNCPKCGSTVEFDNRDKKKEIKKTERAGQEFPSADELESELSNFASETTDEESLNIQDMDLPDIENMGEISEEGETAFDAINVTGGKGPGSNSGVKPEDAELDFKIDDDTADNFLNEFDDAGIGGKNPQMRFQTFPRLKKIYQLKKNPKWISLSERI